MSKSTAIAFKSTVAAVAIGGAIAMTGVMQVEAQEGGIIPGNPSQAIYGDQIIDLSQGWAGAGACIELGTETRCYDTEAQLQQAHPQPRAACSTATRLYDGTSHTGSALHLTTRGAYINLSGHGFDNRTSSYRVGACGASFFDGTNGGGSVYPGSTGAGSSAGSMASGWDNRVSSVYIY